MPGRGVPALPQLGLGQPAEAAGNSHDAQPGGVRAAVLGQAGWIGGRVFSGSNRRVLRFNPGGTAGKVRSCFLRQSNVLKPGIAPFPDPTLAARFRLDIPEPRCSEWVQSPLYQFPQSCPNRSCSCQTQNISPYFSRESQSGMTGE